MPIDYARLKNRVFQDLTQEYGWKDCILYALGAGLGHDPTDRDQLRFVHEDGLRVLPTMPVVLATPGFWLKQPDTGVDWKSVLHGEQRLTLHKPLSPRGGRVRSRLRIEEIVDKGAGKGALIYLRRDLLDADSGELLAEIGMTSFCRADGGFGGPSGPVPEPHPVPQRAPDVFVDFPTVPQAALIYRLSGDYNPLHIDPEVATSAGFRQPILHGLCTYAVAGHAVLKTLCDYRPERLRRFDVRFSSPVFPGETLRTEIWRESTHQAALRCRVLERDVVVLNNGLATWVD